MPTAHHGDVSLYYETDGDGAPVVFVGDVGYGAWQWGWQYAAVAGPYQTVVPDLRGVGQSDTPPGPYSVADLVGDLEAILSDVGVRNAHVVGAGLGGLVGLAAANTTARVRSLAVVGAAASGTAFDVDPLFGAPDDPDALRSSLDPALAAEFRATQSAVVDQVVEWRATEDAARDAWEAQAAALREFDYGDCLYEVTVPTLVLHGTDDAVVPVAAGESLADGLPRGEFVPLDGAGHLAHIEHSRPVNDELLAFLDRVEDPSAAV